MVSELGHESIHLFPQALVFLLSPSHLNQPPWLTPLLIPPSTLSIQHWLSRTLSSFLVFRKVIRTQFEWDIKNIQCDNGREFDNGPFWEFCNLMACFFVSLVLMPNHKMEKLREKFEPSTKSFTPYLHMRPYLLRFGIMYYKWPPTSSTFFLIKV